MLTIQTIKAICIYDEAIDHERLPQETMLKYAKNRDFKTIEPFIKPGTKPTIYNVKRLSRSVLYKRIQSISDESTKYLRCFQYGLESAENVIGEMGTVYDYAPEGREGDMSIVSEEELERIPPCDVMEIGTMIWYMSFLRPGTENGLAVPPTSLDIWARVASQNVPANPTDPVQSNSKQVFKGPLQESKATEQTPENVVNNSVRRTDATAEVQG